MKKLKEIDWLRPFKWLWMNIRMILTLILIVLCIVICYQNIQMKKQRVFNMHRESFDLTRIPSGLLLWSHGVPGMEADFKHSKTESLRYYYFDVAILTNNGVIHLVRLPYYAVIAINANGIIDFKERLKKKQKKSNPNNSFYVYPIEEQKKLNNL